MLLFCFCHVYFILPTLHILYTMIFLINYSKILIPKHFPHKQTNEKNVDVASTAKNMFRYRAWSSSIT